MNIKTLQLRYFVYDLISSLIVWVLFVVFRKTINNISILNDISLLVPNIDYVSSLIFFPFCCALVHYLSGVYVNPLSKSRVNLFFTTFVSTAIIAIMVFFVVMLGDVTVSFQYFYYSMLMLFFLLLSVTYFFRSLIFSEVKKNFTTKKWTINTLIIGTGKNALKIASDLQIHARQNTIVGFVANTKQIEVSPDEVLGNLAQMEAIIAKYNIQEAIVALDSNVDEQQIFKILNSLYKFDISIQFTPRLYEILIGSAKISPIGIIPLVSLTHSSMPDWELCCKRFMDIIISTLALVFLSPFLLYFIFKIKIDSKGPAFYKQERIGRLGKPFNIYKFRTMFLNSENGVPKLSSADDIRITKIGRILRKYRIDEIPQFWNIIKGDMSLVGPRPERRYYINQIIDEAPYYCLLYKIRPGLTSWGPIKIGYSDSVEKMIERLNYDIIYIENMSLVNDIKILIYTVEIIFNGKGV